MRNTLNICVSKHALVNQSMIAVCMFQMHALLRTEHLL